MSSYLNDPREMAIRPESGVTLEEDNRYEEMYHWGAMVLDLCNLPVSEYMKPMTVIVSGTISSGGTSGDTSGNTSGTTEEKDVNIFVTIIDPDGNEYSGNTTVLSANSPILGDSITKTWKIRWQWTGDFTNSVAVAVQVKTDKGVYSVSDTLMDNSDKKQEKDFTLAEDENVSSFQTYGVAKTGTDASEITNTTYQETVSTGTKKTIYNYTVSKNETILAVKLTLWNSGTSEVHENLRFGSDISTYIVDKEKEGYTFKGWFDINNIKFSATTMPAKNLELYAHYDIKEYNVTFTLSGEQVASYSVKYGEVIPESAIPSTEKEGYTFNGWEPSVTDAISADTNFVGEYTVNSYSLTFVVDGKETVSIVEYGATIEYPENPTKVGYTFTEWDYSGTTMPASDLVITAQFEINSYTYTFSSNGEVISSGKTEYNTIPTKPTDPTKESDLEYDYTFDKWEPEVEAISADTNYVAQFSSSARLYTINWYNEDTLLDTKEATAHTEVHYSSAVTKESTAQYDYTFEGWNPEEKAVDGNQDYYAVFSAKTRSYDATFKYGVSGESAYTVSTPYGEVPSLGVSASTIMADIENDAYKASFNSWNPTVEEITGVTDFTAIYDIVTKQYTVSINSDYSEDYDYGTTLNINDLLTDHTEYLNDKKYTITSITVNGEEKQLTDDITVTGAMAIIVNYDDVYYTVTWKNEDDTVISEKADYKYMDSVEEATAPEKAGYTFEDWTPTVQSAVTENATYKAVYKVNVHTLSYTMNGTPTGTETGSTELAYGLIIMNALPDESYTGYNKENWKLGENDLLSTDTMPDNDISVTRQYNVLQCNVNIKDGESLVYSGSVNFGTPFSAITSSQKIREYIDEESANGYTIGFSLADDDIISADTNVSVTKVPNKYQLTFTNSGNIISQEDKEFGTIISYPEMSGYTDEESVDWTFKWENTKYSGATMPNSAITINGHYESASQNTALIYYGAVLNGQISADDVTSLPNFDANEATSTGKTVTIDLPADEYYVEMSGDDDWIENYEEEYIATHMYPTCVFVPKSVADKYTLGLALAIFPGSDLGPTKSDNTITINGTEYYKYSYGTDKMHAADQDQEWIYIITLK